MNDFDINSFKEVKLSDKDCLSKHLAKQNKILCDFTFANLFTWSDIYQTRWKIYNGLLLIYNSKDDFLFQPCGEKFDTGLLLAVSDSLRAQKKKGNYILMEQDFVEANKDKLSENFRIEIDMDDADYIYLSKNLVELKGNKLHKKKNLVSQFKRNNPEYKCAALEKKYFDDCFKFAEKWCLDKSCDEIGFTHEKSALKKALDNYSELGLDGLLIFVKENICAFSIFSKQNDKTFTIHYEKYDTKIKGSAQIINWETAKYLQPKCEFINREQDLGIDGLRQAKKSYEPYQILATYQLIRK